MTATKRVAKGKAAQPASPYPFTAEDIVRERDEQGQSWRKVAEVLGLANPGRARQAYTELTGRPHYESRMPERSAGRAPRGTTPRARKKAASLDPKWGDHSDQDEIVDKLDGAYILVRRESGHEEEVHVKRVTEFSWGGSDETLCVHLISAYNLAHRCFRVRDIVEVSATSRRRKTGKKNASEDNEAEDTEQEPEEDE